MKRFPELSNQPVSQREMKISEYWEKIDLLHKSVETRMKTNPIFYEGLLQLMVSLEFTMLWLEPKDLVCR